MNKEERAKKVEYQTYLLNVNIDNEQSNYNYIIGQGERLLVADDYDLKVMLKRNCKLYDKIEWDFINWDKVRENIANLQRGQ